MVFTYKNFSACKLHQSGNLAVWYVRRFAHWEIKARLKVFMGEEQSVEKKRKTSEMLLFFTKFTVCANLF